MNASPLSAQFIAAAQAKGLTAAYSGKAKKMLVNGDDKAVKSFIRIQCLKGKNHYPFAFGQGQTTPSA